MYVSPINNKILVFDCRKSEQSRKQNLSFQKTQVLLEQKNPVKKINRYMNIAIIAMLPILCYQIQNQVNEITKEYIQFEGAKITLGKLSYILKTVQIIFQLLFI